MRKFLEQLKSGAFESSEIEFDEKYSFTRWCLLTELLSTQPSHWNQDVENLDYEPRTAPDSLNMQVIQGELRSRFAKGAVEPVLRVIHTLQAEHGLIQSQPECQCVSNIATFVYKAYLDDVAQYREEPERKYGFLEQPSEPLLFNLLTVLFHKPRHSLEDFFFLCSQIDPELTAHLQLFQFNELFFQQSLFVDVLPDMLLKRLLQAALKEQNWTFLGVYYFLSLSYNFKQVLLKVKQPAALRHICKEAYIASIRSSTVTDFDFVMELACNFYGYQLKNNRREEQKDVFQTIVRDNFQADITKINPKELRLPPMQVLDMKQQIFTLTSLQQKISTEIEYLISRMQVHILGEVSKGRQLSQEKLLKMCRDVKRIRDVLINILPTPELTSAQLTLKIGVIREVFADITEKQRELDALNE